MAIIICPNCGGENNITKKSGQECVYCGTIFAKKNLQAIKSDKKEKFNILYKDAPLIYKTKISPTEAIRAAKKYVIEQLKKALNDKSEKEYWEYISPIEQKAKLFKYVAKLYYVPNYLFEFDAQKGDYIDNYEFISFGGTNSGYPMEIIYDFKEIKRRLEIELDTSIDSNSYGNRKFVKSPMEIWDSLYTKKELDNFIRYENPEVKCILLPYYVVEVYIGDKKEKNKEIIALDWDGKIISYFYPQWLLAKYYLGENYHELLEDRKKSKEDKIDKRKKRIGNYIGNLLLVLICLLVLWFIGGKWLYNNYKEKNEQEKIKIESEKQKEKETLFIQQSELLFKKNFVGKEIEGNDYFHYIRIRVLDNNQLEYQTGLKLSTQEDVYWDTMKKVKYELEIDAELNSLILRFDNNYSSNLIGNENDELEEQFKIKIFPYDYNCNIID